MHHTFKRALLLLGLALALPVASCGGGTSVTAPASPQTLSADSGTAAESGSGMFSGLPAIPLEAPTGHAAAEAGTPPPNVVVLGKDFLQAAGETVDGDAVILSTGDITPPGQGGGGQLSYAMYKVPSLGDKRPLSLNVECLPGEFGQGYFIGVANYTMNRWAWFGPVTLPEFQLDLSKQNHRFVTALGNMYFILVCPPNASITHSQTTVVLGGDSGQLPPGVAFGLHASDGGADHKVVLDWQPGPGAQQYVVWRKRAFAGAPWQPLAPVQGTHFEDAPLPNFRLHFYRVQASNPNGQAQFSNVDSGYAGLRAPGDIGGTVMGPQGEPLGGVPVLLGGYGEEMVRVSDQQGHFGFKDLPPSHYFVAPQGATIEFDPPVAGVDLTSNQHASVEFHGHPAGPNGVIWGFVMTPNMNPDGNGDDLLPMPGVTVSVAAGLDPSTPPLRTATTNEVGFYGIPELAAGPYRVWPQQEGMNFAPPAQGVGIGPQNRRERASFIGLPPPPDGGNQPPPGGGGDPGDPNGGQ
jgi:hypothetical protein